MAKSTKKTAKKTKAAATKKTSKKVVPKKAEQPEEHGIFRNKDVRWCDKKVSIFKALKQLRAVNPGSARSAKSVAEKASVSVRDALHYCYHAKAAKLTDIADVEGVRGHALYLTAKGAKINPAAELKAQEAAKKAK